MYSALCPKKVVHQIRGDNFVTSQRILNILSLLESEVAALITIYSAV